MRKAILAAVVLTGCASTSDIDMSKVEPACGLAGRRARRTILTASAISRFSRYRRSINARTP
jgi:hypothetical protein